MSDTAQDTTDRKTVADRFGRFFELAPDAIIVVDDKGTIVLVNAQTETLFGHRRADLVGKKIEMLMPEGIRVQHRKHRAGYVAKPRMRPMGQSLELMGLARDGREIPIEISLSPIETPEGLLVAAAVRDITERKQAEAALRESEARYRDLFETSPIGFWEEDYSAVKHLIDRLKAKGVTDFRDYFHKHPKTLKKAVEAIATIDVNQATLNIHGATDKAAFVVRRSAYRETMHEYYIDELAALAEGNRRIVTESPLDRVDGSRTMIRNIMILPEAYRESWARLVTSEEDITERKQAEDGLRESEARLRRAQEIARIGSFEWDEKADESIHRSEEICDIYGVSPDDGIRTIDDFMDLIHPDDRDRIRAAYAERRGSGEGYDLEFRIRRPDGGTRHLHEISSPVFDDAGVHVRSSGTVQDITERVRADEALRASEAGLAAAQRIARLGNWEWDVEAGRTIWSDELYRIMGADPAEAIISDDRFDGFVHPDDRDTVRAINRTASKTGEPSSVDYRIVRPDGVVRHIHEQAQTTEWNDGKAVRVVGTAQDITERKLAEAALRESERSLINAQRLARVGHWQWQIDSDTAILSDEIYRIVGRSGDTFDGTAQQYRDLIYPDDLEILLSAGRSVQTSHTHYNNEYRIVRPDGSLRHVNETAEATVDPVSGSVRLIGAVQDITVRKQADEALRESEERLRVFMDNSPAAVALKDGEGRYRLVNKRFEDWYGFRSDDVLGKTVGDLFPKSDADAYAASEREVLETVKMIEREYEVAFADGTRHHLAIATFPVFDADGRPVGVGSIDTDVTEQRQTATQLRQAQKMEAVGQLTGGIAHDFNNLLAVIAGNLELLDEAVEGHPEAQELLRWAIDAADDAATLTQRLLAFSRRQPLRPQIVEVNDMVRGLLNLLRRSLGEVVEIGTALADDPWPTLVDAGQLESALLNLVLNARDALPAAGSGLITIETANVVLDVDDASEVGDIEPGDYVVLMVSDTGRGMAPEVLDRAFEPFFTTKGVGEGSGLGLSMVYGFAMQSGGQARIDSEEGRGTAAKLYLPRAVKSNQPAAAPAREPNVRGDGEKVLVVEDDDKVRDLAVKVITGLGYTVCAAADGTIALDMIEKASDIDVMVTDIVLPSGMSGRELAEVVAARRPKLKVIYTSGYPADVISHGGKLDDGVVLLSKPYRREVLAQALHQALGAGAD